MKDIAKDAQIYRSTLYRYFPKKENLAFYVVNQLLFELSQQCHAMVDQRGTGYEQMCQFVHAYEEILLAHPEYLRLFSDFDNTSAELSQQHAEENQSYAKDRDQDFEKMADYVRLGISDGSIKPETNPMQFMLALFNAMFGVAQRVIANGDVIFKQHNVYGRDVLSLTIETMLASVKQA